jgi:hypothetical protein
MPLPTAFGKPAPRTARTYRVEGFNVVATQFDDYRVDEVLDGIKDPIPGPSFPTLEAAKNHIALTQKTLSDSVMN